MKNPKTCPPVNFHSLGLSFHKCGLKVLSHLQFRQGVTRAAGHPDPGPGAQLSFSAVAALTSVPEGRNPPTAQSLGRRMLNR